MSVLLFWDASALVKRYFLETGSETVDALFVVAGAHEVATTPWSYADTYSILLRRYNNGAIDATSFAGAVGLLEVKVIDDPGFRLLSIEDRIVFGSVPVMRAHNLNATDAALLALLIEHRGAAPPGSARIALVSSDARLLRAGHLEGFATINPEVSAAADVPALLATS